jgi:hypothetical protein
MKKKLEELYFEKLYFKDYRSFVEIVSQAVKETNKDDKKYKTSFDKKKGKIILTSKLK